MTLLKFLKQQEKRAAKLNKEEEAIKILILELSGLNGAEFVARLNDKVDDEFIAKMTEAIDKYLIDGIPVQHIVGYSYFYGYKFKVSPDVLIPRCETEELVGYVLQYYDNYFKGQKVDVADVGTGSGAIAISLSLEEPNMKVSATDISPEAIEVAKYNAKTNNANVEFMVGDMLEPLIEKGIKLDILVSNPPYIPDDEEVQDIVLNNEPHVALFGGKDGMHFYDVILSNAKKVLKEKNIIAFEHSYSKGQAMHDLAKKYFPNAEVTLIKDLEGKDRMTIIVNK